MTYKEFEATVKHFRNDIQVSKHGDFCHNKSRNTLGIVFLKEDGNHSRVYDYSGSYSEILSKLGIREFYTDDMIDYCDREIDRLSKENGKKCLNLFAGDSESVYDHTERINELKERKATLLTYYRAGKC